MTKKQKLTPCFYDGKFVANPTCLPACSLHGKNTPRTDGEVIIKDSLGYGCKNDLSYILRFQKGTMKLVWYIIVAPRVQHQIDTMFYRNWTIIVHIKIAATAVICLLILAETCYVGVCIKKCTSVITAWRLK